MGKKESRLDGWANAIDVAHERWQKQLHEWSESLPEPDHVLIDKRDEYEIIQGFWRKPDGSGVLMARKLKNGDWCRSDAETYDAGLIEILYAILKGNPQQMEAVSGTQRPEH